jgi:uncharacterized coiled-coil DUF342 family protein
MMASLSTQESPESAAPPAVLPRAAVCILGMHRSGTSALARVVNLLGVELGDDLLEARVDNPKGFWEARQITETHEHLLEALGSFFDDFFPLPKDWATGPVVPAFKQKLTEIARSQFGQASMWGFKDPRTSRLVPLWEQIFPALKSKPVYILVARSPDEIAKSLAVRNGYPYNKSLLLTARYKLDAELATRGKPRVFVTFDELLSDWRKVTDRISGTLGLTWKNSPDSIAPQVAAFLDIGLRHHHADDSTASSTAAARSKATPRPRDADPSAVCWAFGLHDLYAAASESDGSRIDTDAVDAIASEFDSELPRLSCWHESKSMDQMFMKIETWAKGWQAEVKRVEAENADLRRTLANISNETPSATDDPKTSGRRLFSFGSNKTSSPDGKDTTIANLQQANRALDEASRQAAAQAHHLTAALAVRDANITRLETHNRELNLARQWITDEKAAADRELQKYTAEAPLTQQKLADLEAQITELKAHVADLEQGRDFHKAEHEKATDELAKLQAWGDELKSGCDFLKSEQEKAVTELANRDGELARLQKWVQSLERARDFHNAEHAKATEEIASRDQEIQRLKAWAAELTSARDWHATELAKSAGALDQKDQELAKLRGWADELKTGRDWLAQQVENLKLEQSRRDTALSETRAWVKELEEAKSWLESQRNSLISELKRRESELAELRSAL